MRTFGCFFPDLTILERGAGFAIALEIQAFDLQLRVVAKQAIGPDEWLNGFFKR